MVKGNLVTNDPYSIHANEEIRDKVRAQSKHLQRLLMTWEGKLSYQQLFEMAFILNLHMDTIKSYIKHGSKRVNFKIYIALAILCYLEVNYSHLKD